MYLSISRFSTMFFTWLGTKTYIFINLLYFLRNFFGQLYVSKYNLGSLKNQF